MKFQLMNSLINVAKSVFKSVFSLDLVTFTEEILNGKLHFYALKI